jgi:predicted 3-demethylubiquinone-9 3-methyltransferase (glyoxalase superfamily)
LWFDNEVEEAVERYVKLFDKSKILNTINLTGTPSGDVLIIDFQLANLTFSAMNAGPNYQLNSSISLMVSCNTVDEVDRLYHALAKEGDIHIPLDTYEFSSRYAWIADKYGLNWQLMYVEGKEEKHTINPSLLFSMDMCGKAEEAMKYYMSVFKDSSKGYVSHYKVGEASDRRAKTNYAQLNLFGQQLILMDHRSGGNATFNEAFSLVILCDDQKEIDRYWKKLSFVPEAEACGWAKDQFGLSWQITPVVLNELLINSTKEEALFVTEAFLKMKKMDINVLRNSVLQKKSGEINE